MEDKLRMEAKNLVDAIKEQRSKLRDQAAQESAEPEFILQSDGEVEPPQLLAEPKRRRLLKGHFGKVSIFNKQFKRVVRSIVFFLLRRLHAVLLKKRKKLTKTLLYIILYMKNILSYN
jgi:hypothetical protein